MTANLVALDLPGGPAFVAALQHVWDRGDAAFPVDQRLPLPAKQAVFEAIAPSSVIRADGTEAHRDGGRPVEPGDALVVATSGTTGAPKGVVLTHEAVAASASASSSRLGVTADDHWLACLPMSHVGGLSVVTRALHCGTRLSVHPGFDADAVSASTATLVSLVATALRRIDASQFRRILLGGSRPPADRPANSVATYGMTETGSGIVYDGWPLDGVELRIDHGHDRDARGGDAPEGEILVRAPMLLRCYRDGPVDWRDGWLPTGDLGHLTTEGQLVVRGRARELIITGGENVWPEQVESVLSTHPEVADVAVCGLEDAEWGQIVTAFVVPTTGAVTLDQLRSHVRATLPAYMAPRRLVLTNVIPRTSLGKIARHLLQP